MLLDLVHKKVIMLHFNYRHMLTGAIATSYVALMASSVNALESSQPEFAELCEAFQGIPDNWSSVLYTRPYAWPTVDSFMAALAVTDCEVAEQKLAEVTVLRGPQLQTAYLSDSGLMVDFPIGVDLQVIAIATPNLTDLNLNGRVIHDLRYITALDQLQTLRLANTQLSDIAPLAALNQLTTLDISYNQLDNIAPVADISTLRSLNVAYNPLTDVSPIAAILTPETELEWQLLDLSGINIDATTCPDNLGDICGDSLEIDR